MASLPERKSGRLALGMSISLLKRTETLRNVLVNVFMKIHSKRPSGCYDTGHAVRTFEYFF